MFENFCARQWQQLWVTSCWNTGFLIETSQQGGDWTESILLTPWMKPLACVRFVFLLYYLLAPVLISISNPPPANASGQGGEVCYVRTNNGQQRQTDCLACYTTPLCVQKCARFVGRCHFGNIRLSDFWSIHVVCFLLFSPLSRFLSLSRCWSCGGCHYSCFRSPRTSSWVFIQQERKWKWFQTKGAINGPGLFGFCLTPYYATDACKWGKKRAYSVKRFSEVAFRVFPRVYTCM